MQTRRKLLSAGLALGLLGCAAGLSAQVINPGTFVKATINAPDSLDPHFMVASATMELSLNVYDSLLGHDKADSSKLVPALAATVPSLGNGLIKVAPNKATSITFPIRKGVKFHSGHILDAGDVAYTFKRGIIVGGQTAVLKMLSINLLDANTFADLVKAIGFDAAFQKLDKAIVAGKDSVTFNLLTPFVPFLEFMADEGSSAGIFSKAWCASQGDWDGTKENASKFIGLKLEDDKLFMKMNGTGSFRFVSWEKGERVVFEAFPDSWQGAPQLKRVVVRFIKDAQTGIMLLKAGDADLVAVGVSDIPQLKGAPGIELKTKIPSAWLMKMNFVMNIAPQSSYIGDGKLGPNGVPPNLFSDINVRKGFAYAFDYNTFIDSAMGGYAQKPYGPVLIGFPTANPANPQYTFDLAKAKEHLMKAWDGKLWTQGFKMTLVYSAGSKQRQVALEILKDNLESLNPKFKMELASLPFAGYIGAIGQKTIPISLLGILPDVFDPYFSLFEHMHSAGGYAERGGYVEYAKKNFDDLVETVGREYDPQKRKDASYKLQRLDYEFVPAILHYQVTENVALRSWLKGYVPRMQPTNLDYSQFSK
ncbi:MAG: ABC transporter substrate-binding protein [Treponemataceae bacterium]